MKEVIFEKVLSVYLIEKAPYQIPPKWRKSIISWIPILTMLVVVLGLFNLNIAVENWLAGDRYAVGMRYWLSIIFTLAFVIVHSLALPALFARKRFGWELLYYYALLGIVENVISLDVVGLLFDVLSLYLLFQVKPAYQ